LKHEILGTGIFKGYVMAFEKHGIL